MSNQRLRDRIAVVTGGGRGIGRAIALLMAEQGAAVVVNDLGCDVDGGGSSTLPAEETAAAIRAAGGRAVANCEDVSRYAAAAALMEATLREFGRIDILVNCAGILRERMFFQTAEEEWDRVIAVNLKGSFNCARHASPHMRQQRFGRILHMTSTAGLYGYAGLAAYGASKDAVASLTRNISRDLGRYGITVNAIAPIAATRMAGAVMRGVNRAGARAASSFVAPRSQPEDIAPFAVYLASEAAANINGQIFVVDGGSISLLNYPAPVRSMLKPSRWTPEEIAALFPRALGMETFHPAPRRHE